MIHQESFTFIEDPAEDLVKVLQKKLVEHAEAAGAPLNQKELAILHKNAQGEMIAGLSGFKFWEWFFVDLLWVNKEERDKGLGSALLKAAEEKAAAWGCHGIYLFTQSWQAPRFYAERGYTSFVEMPDFPKGFKRFGFIKRLV